MPNAYELMLIFKTSVAEESRQKTVETIRKLLKTSPKLDVQDWGKRQFAYPVKKEKEGNYYLLKLNMEGKEALEVKKSLQLKEGILRYLLVRQQLVKKKKRVKRERK